MSRNEIGMLLVIVVAAWIFLADVVFALRHPWATETERLIYLPKAMMFQSVDYDEMRPRR